MRSSTFTPFRPPSMKSSTFIAFAIAILSTLAAAQDIVTIPTSCGNYTAGSDEVFYTLPYTYDQVVSIIGNFSNLTYAGSPDGSVSINGTDNTVGTARTYHISGAKLVETLQNYSKPAAPGPYYEKHNTANITLAGNSVYIPFDATTVTSVCNGKASMINITSHFCATNVTFARSTLHTLHMGGAVTVGKFLGGKNFTDCAALGASNMSSPTNYTRTGGMAPTTGGENAAAAQTTVAPSGAASRSQAGWWSAAVGVACALLML